MSRPVTPLLTFRNSVIANYVSSEMYVGFSSGKTTWIEAQRVLAWSFSDTGVARNINTTGLPVFLARSESSSGLSTGAKTEVAIKCVNHDSKQGLKEFMAEISSMGRLHKNLVQMRGWCRKVVVHRDIKSSNVLLDFDMRGRLGDFGLAKLYTQGEEPGTTRVVGTLGYLVPELAMLASPTTASDVYSFGVVVLEVACGRKPIETWQEREEDMILVDLVREKYIEGKLVELADGRIKGEYDMAEMEAVLKLGLSCCHPDPLLRPTMKEVVALLLGEDTAVSPRVVLQESKKEPSP
ncbi:hypothetical protein L1987_80099 [Smallanthus sonchifolius]|uniref:Uncharacterized protein n=1 Tax=Smallanthus sonchifolius TaxID=185202 RepID=A0ACB8YMB0_9ASTR|nr:hypothetical protein L1987_80099 [Smallanthus sonchifolius]